MNEHFANIKSVVNNENGIGLANLYDGPDCLATMTYLRRKDGNFL